MHGLINRAIQNFVIDTYGPDQWSLVARAMGVGQDGFEPMLSYETRLTLTLLVEVSRTLDKPIDMVLEDVGTYLVSHPKTEVVRRLLRFGGGTFSDFLHSLNDLPDMARLALADIDAPEIEVTESEGGRFVLQVTGHPGFAYALTGILRALADDYGVLAYLERNQNSSNLMTIEISLLDSAFSKGRSFSLVRPAQARGDAAIKWPD